MSLLHLLGAPGDGGAETYFLALIEALQTAGLNQAAATRPWPSRDRALTQMGVPLTNLPFTPAMGLVSRIGAARFARKVEAKIIMSWMSRAASVAPKGPWARIGRLGGYYDLKYFRGDDVLVGNTPDIVRHIVDGGWPAERALYIPNFAKPDDSSALSRAALDTPEGVPLFLGMGRLHSDKAHDITLRALTMMPEAWLWIAGSGPLDGELRALAASLGVVDRVRFLGWRQDAGALYRAADVCLFPSRIEPLGNVVIQAWAYGLPIVAAASKGPASLIRDGDDGLLIPMEDPAALAEAAGRALTDQALRARLIAGGAARIAGDFSERAVVAQWTDLFARYGVTPGATA